MTAEIADFPAVRTGSTARASGRTRRMTGMSRPSQGRRNPYLVPRLAVVSLSGGRTCGYMLNHIVDAHGGRLPDDVAVVFANTGMERPETLGLRRHLRHRLGRADRLGVNGGGIMRQSGGVKLYHGLGGSLSP